MNLSNLTTRCSLQEEMTKIGFYLDDLRLYLDTHPGDTEVVALYNDYAQQYQTLHCAYVTEFGPYSYYDINNADCWEWVDAPWPWEGGV